MKSSLMVEMHAIIRVIYFRSVYVNEDKIIKVTV